MVKNDILINKKIYFFGLYLYVILHFIYIYIALILINYVLW